MTLNVAVSPSDLYTILRVFYESDRYRCHSQAERQAADRINTALIIVGWGYEFPRGKEDH